MVQFMGSQRIRHNWATELILINMSCYLIGVSISLEKEMAIHSSILAWETPWTEEPVRLQLTKL